MICDKKTLKWFKIRLHHRQSCALWQTNWSASFQIENISDGLSTHISQISSQCLVQWDVKPWLKPSQAVFWPAVCHCCNCVTCFVWKSATKVVNIQQISRYIPLDLACPRSSQILSAAARSLDGRVLLPGVQLYSPSVHSEQTLHETSAKPMRQQLSDATRKTIKEHWSRWNTSTIMFELCGYISETMQEWRKMSIRYVHFHFPCS